MKRISIIQVILVLSVLLAGCMSFTGTDTQPTDSSAPTAKMEATQPTQETTVSDTTQTTTYAVAERGGWLRATLVTEPPENATVVAFNNSTIDHPLLSGAVENAYETGNYSAQIGPDEKENILNDLSTMPRYNGTGGFGHYIEFRDTVIRVQVIQYG